MFDIGVYLRVIVQGRGIGYIAFEVAVVKRGIVMHRVYLALCYVLCLEYRLGGLKWQDRRAYLHRAV